ncbi:vigilin-like [Argonauta hians]
MATEVVSNIEDEAYEPQTYDEAFPALLSDKNDAPVTSNASHGESKFARRCTKTTQIFTVPLEERRFKEINEHSFGEEGEQAKICREIMQKTGVSIEMSLARDQSLTVVISGKPDDVMKARREVVSELQTQASYAIKIPKEHHRFILGKNGKKLHELELNTETKIILPRGENTDVIRIVGTKEGVEKARHEIQCTSDEQAKLAFERLPVPKIYHPFICGPHNNNIKSLMDSTNVRINVPPPSVMKDEIVVSGEKEGVMKAKSFILKTLEEKKKKCQPVSVEVRKCQHKYVIGQKRANIQEILEATGVSVEVPSLESPSGTITLRGEEDKLGSALTMVYSKANSVIVEEVKAPAWLHRFIIGKQGSNIKKITQNTPKVHIEFTEGQDKIDIEGPPEEVSDCVQKLTECIDDLNKRMDFDEIAIDQRFHKHIIGKNGANITRIKSDTGVAIQIPSDNSNIIRIEGDPAGVRTAKQELLEMAQRMENEKSRDIIIEQRFHKTIIGARGEKIREIRDKFNQVQISFPDAGKKSDVVTLRGPKNDVDKAYQHLSQYQQELVTNNYQAQVQIFKEFHKNIIGKGGATIKKIRDETDTRIELPHENLNSDMIVVTGKKANVEQARKKIEAIQKELANIKEITVEIPSKFHNSIIGAKGRLIRAILDDCTGVHIRFPPEGSACDKVVIRGPPEDAENACKQLRELTSEKQLSSYTATIRAQPAYHKFLIGTGGSKINKVREKTGARVIFPNEHDPDPELITVIGKKESVEQAKVELENLIQNLDNVVEGEISVDPKHHRYFVARRGGLLRQIAEDYGGVTVSFPRSGVKSDRVVIKGAKDCVEGAKRKILDIVADLDAQVVVECVIPQKYHRTVMGSRGLKVQEITRQYDVGIKFPDRPVNGERVTVTPTEEDTAATAIPNGDVSPSTEPTPALDSGANKTDVILITGKPENCEEAKKALLALVPITLEVEVPFEFHRFIIGQKGKDVRKMMEAHEVSITVPPPEEKSNVIKVTGPPNNVEGAKQALEERCTALENEKQDRLLRSFKLEVEVESQYHPKIIGRKGAVISKIRLEHDVNIQFPERNDAQNIITISGYENNAKMAKKAILEIVQELEDMSSVVVSIDPRVHPRIIGTKGRTVRRLMDDYKVDIKFPRPESDEPDAITITGAEEDCLDCREYLLAFQEEYLQDIIDQEYLKELHVPSRSDVNGNQKESKGFFVKDAPWDKVPDTNSTDEFPSFGTVVPLPKSSQAWGPTKRK